MSRAGLSTRMTEIRVPELKFLSFREHVGMRNMWKGSPVVGEQKLWMLSEGNRFRKQVVDFSEALFKCFDEILVNAVDQYVNTIQYPEEYGGRVTEIRVEFNQETGEISVCNTGAGIPVFFVEEKNRWSVELLITEPYSGSNFDDRNEPERVTGGINGVGIKVINIDSLSFEVETVDSINRRYYRQLCRNRMEEILPPKVVELRDSNQAKTLHYTEKAPHTRIKFLPDYSQLCRKTQNLPDPSWLKGESKNGNTNLQNFQKLIETRMLQTAAFIGSINYRFERGRKISYRERCRVFYNNREVQCSGTVEYCRLLGAEEIVPLTLEQRRKQDEQGKTRLLPSTEGGETLFPFPWYVAVGLILPGSPHSRNAGEQVSLLNGVHLTEGGAHSKWLKSQILGQLRVRAQREFKQLGKEAVEGALNKLLVIVDCKQIPVPQFSGGNLKEGVKLSSREAEQIKTSFLLTEAEVNKLWKMVKAPLELLLAEKEVDFNKKKKKEIPIRKYQKAEKLGAQSLLFTPEGDSACTTVKNVLYSKQSSLNPRLCGLYNLQGVPMNARKKIKKIVVGGEARTRVKSELMSNVALQGLVQVLGLSYEENYYWGPPEEDPRLPNLDDEGVARLYRELERGNKMFSTLKYGRGMVLATDQDLDGIGQICSLVLVFIMCFWPDLIKRGFVHRWATPIVRVYHGKDPVINFFSEDEFHRWREEKFSSFQLPKGWEAKYYKGLASHSKEENQFDMAPNLNRNIITFTWDSACETVMEMVYGPATQGRKSLLMTPVDREYNPSLWQRQKVALSDHFLIASKGFQLDNLKRKLKCAIDGFIPSQRKAFAGARVKFSGGGRAVKVYQLTGFVTDRMGYKHGDTSMNDTIIKMAQTFPGSNNIPPFLPVSNGFGDRVNGRGITGSPRYIDLKYNNKVMDLLFPREDDFLLEYVFEEGEQCEPCFYVPILPYAILETSTTAGTGWKISCWAREFQAVIKGVRYLIEGEKLLGRTLTTFSLQGKPWLWPGMSVVMGSYNTGRTFSEICRGSYTWHPNTQTLVVTQLPLKLWSHNFRCGVLGLDAKTEQRKVSKIGVGSGRKKPLQRTRKTPAPQKTRKTDGFVKGCVDRTANDECEILIQLEPGAMEKIELNYGNEWISPAEDCFEMTQQMLPQLNMFTHEDCIREFSSYEEVLNYWYPLRRKLYQERLVRRNLLQELLILYEENRLRFILADASGELKIDKEFTDREREEILEKAGYQRFDESKLLHPRYLRNSELKEKILEGAADYSYIDRITVKMKSKKLIHELEEKISSLKKELEKLKELSWQELWLQELSQLEVEVVNGLRTGWRFSKEKHTFRSL